MPGRSPDPERPLWLLLGALAAVAFGLCGYLFLRRIGYPFELEWMEGAMVDHAARILAGQPLYAPPSVEHVPFLYTPLLFWLGAGCSTVVGIGYLALRLVSVAATIACVVLVWKLASREGARRLCGFLAAGLFLAGYGLVDSWYDLARNDTLFVALVLGVTWLLRRGGMRAAVLAGALTALAFLAKQTALLWLPAVGVGLLVLDWRRGLAFGIASAVCLGAAILSAHLLTDGWFTFYVFDMPRAHGILADRRLGFFTEDLLPLLPMVLLALGHVAGAWKRGAKREAAFWLCFGGGALLASYLSRLHAGGHSNVLMYALAGGAVLSGCALGTLCSRWARWSALLLAVLQFGLLAYDPGRFLPRAEHRRASEELVRFLRGQEGDVLVPFHGNLAALAGKPRTAHAQAMFDMLQMVLSDFDAGRRLEELPGAGNPFGLTGRRREAMLAMVASFREALTSGRVGTVVLEQPHGHAFEADHTFGPWLQGFRRLPESPVEEPLALNPRVGMPTHSPYVWQRAR